MGDRGASNMGDRRPRALCPGCGRSTALTFNKRTGEAYIRTHVVTPRQECPWSRRTLPRHVEIR